MIACEDHKGHNVYEIVDVETVVGTFNVGDRNGGKGLIIVYGMHKKSHPWTL